MRENMKKLSVVALVLCSLNVQARDQISIVGSSTVFPFASTVAEHLGQGGKFKTPTVESTGTGGGFKIFCKGVGTEHPDISNASRKIKPAETKDCAGNGASDLVEVKIGYDGIVIAQSIKGEAATFTRKDIYLALAKEVPDPECAQCGKLIENPYKTWDQINSSLPSTQIKVFGPPPSSGTRDAFAELVLESGCNEFDWLKDWKKKDETEYKNMCQSIREDGAYVEAGENDNLIVQKLAINPGSFGIFGYSFLDANTDKVQASKIENVEPGADAIADEVYPISRPLFFYVKKAQIGAIPGIVEYVKEFTSEKAWGDDGYLVAKGLVPMSERERSRVADQVIKALK
jgi:phosphate transport system substrate-binding protein